MQKKFLVVMDRLREIDIKLIFFWLWLLKFIISQMYFCDFFIPTLKF